MHSELSARWNKATEERYQERRDELAAFIELTKKIEAAEANGGPIAVDLRLQVVNLIGLERAAESRFGLSKNAYELLTAARASADPQATRA